MDGYSYMVKAVESAMERCRCSAKTIAAECSMSEHTIYKLLNGQPVRINQEQFYKILKLGGLI